MTERKKNTIFYALLALFVINIFLFNWLLNISSKFNSLSKQIEKTKIKSEEGIISNIVRPQLRFTANSIRESWMKYIENEKDFSLISEKDGKPIYANNYSSLIFNDNTMKKEKIKENIFNIYDKQTGKLLIKEASPQWDKTKVNDILDLLVKSTKNFGNNGGIIVFDSYNGDVFLDTTPVNRTELSPKLTIFQDYENPKNKNVELTKKEISDFIEKKNSNNSSSFTYMFNEPKKMNNPNDFTSYQLGNYNRLFVEKIILPYESFGFDGQPMQLTMLILADEQDIYKSLKENTKDFTKQISEARTILSEAVWFGTGMTIVFMIVILIVIYNLKYTCNRHNACRLKDE